uniref:Helicase-associated domain-containing protein n=1 Tax=Romanomermis culicivorax TaxID=13658 RepID=A0A915KVV0_ROMCU
MSATLRVDDFLQPNLFGQTPPPIVNVESRQYPVVVHFNRRTRDDFLNESLKKCRQIHRKLPEGGVLVFLPGRREVLSLISRLKRAFPIKKSQWKIAQEAEFEKKEEESMEKNSSCSSNYRSSDDEEAEFEKKSWRRRRKKPINKRRPIRLDDYKVDLDESETLEKNFDQSEEDGEAEFNDDDELDLHTDSEEEEMFGNCAEKEAEQPVHVLPLYALLSSEEQKKVFEPPPEGHSGQRSRKSSSLRSSDRRFEIRRPMGRTSAGHCYRLYSSAVFEEFENFSRPEILEKPIDDLVLLMKNMNISNVENFPFPTAPSKKSLKSAEERLLKLGALESCQKVDSKFKMTKITPLGKTMALLPVAPAFAKMLCLGHQQNLLPYVVCLVAGLSVREPLLNLTSLRNESDCENSTTELRAEIQREKCNFDPAFCRNFGFRPKAGLEILKMRRQICILIRQIFPESNSQSDFGPDLPAPDQLQACMLRQILLSGQSWQVAKRLPDVPSQRGGEKLDKNAYKCLNGLEDAVFLHPSSILRKMAPDFVIYQEILESSGKKFMNTVTAVESDWLSESDRNK